MTTRIKKKPYSEPLELQEAWQALYTATGKYIVFVVGEIEGGGVYKSIAYNPHSTLFKVQVVHNGFRGVGKRKKADETFRDMEGALKFYNNK